MKIPKLGDLTDLNKLKKMGSSLAESANVGGVMNKMKQAVGDSGKLLDKAKSTVGLGGASDKEATTDTDEAEATPVAQIQQSLAAIFASQKAQLAAMNQLKQAVSALLKQMPTTQTSSESDTESDETDAQDEDSEVGEDEKDNDSQFRD